MTAPRDEAAHRCLLRFRYPDADSAATVTGAVAVEQDEIDDGRSRATVARDGATVDVDVTARDLVALRAGLNTWTRLVDAAESTLDVAREGVDVAGEATGLGDDLGSGVDGDVDSNGDAGVHGNVDADDDSDVGTDN